MIRGAALIFCSVLAAAPAALASMAPAEVERLLAEVRAKLEANQPNEAVKLAERAVEAAPASAEAYLWLGRAYGQKARQASALFRLGPAKRAKAAFEKVAELDPKNVDARFNLVEFHLEAPGIAGGDEGEARRHAAAIVDLDPLRGHLAWARLHAKDKNDAGVESELRLAAAADPSGRIDGKSALTNFYIGKQRWDDARAVWQASLAADSNDLLARYMLCRVSAFSGTHVDEAVAHLEAYIAGVKAPQEGWPAPADAEWRLGTVYEKAGKSADAAAAYRRALALDPKHSRAKQALERLEKD